MTASKSGLRRRQAERLRSCERKMRALDRCRRACWNGLRWPAPVSDRRGSHPEDRSEDRPCARHHPGARRRRRLGARVGRRDALGGQYRDRKIHQVDPETGAILRTIESNRFVTGVTWVDGELWHATWEGDESDLRRIDPGTGEVLERLEMPPGGLRFRARVRWGRSVLLRRRKEREGEGRPVAQ
jgi:hypothetical protein